MAGGNGEMMAGGGEGRMSHGGTGARDYPHAAQPMPAAMPGAEPGALGGGAGKAPGAGGHAQPHQTAGGGLGAQMPMMQPQGGQGAGSGLGRILGGSLPQIQASPGGGLLGGGQAANMPQSYTPPNFMAQALDINLPEPDPMTNTMKLREQYAKMRQIPGMGGMTFEDAHLEG
jgi:hypothetical protein